MQRILSSLTHRFAFASAALAATALILTSLASWWLINQQHEQALKALSAHELQSRAASLGTDLGALASRMSEISDSTILATGLVDSVGRETYLDPFLDGIRQINGLPVQLMFTDFQGTEIASNNGARFSREQQAWLREHLEAGRPLARVFPSADGGELVAIEPLIYPRTSSPEGALLYKVELRHLKIGKDMALEWSTEKPVAAGSVLVPVPKVFEPLRFGLRDQSSTDDAVPQLPVPFLHVLLISLTLFAAVVLAGRSLANLLTRDLQRLEVFSRSLFSGDLRTERAPEGGTLEVANLARAINGMLDRLDERHSDLLREREKLTSLTEALRTADHNKDNFLAMLGHELRNPLAPITAGAEVLRRLPDTDPRVLRTCEMISRQAGHMTKIINDLLDMSRVTRGQVKLDLVPIELAEVVSGAVEQVRPLMEAKHHSLTVTLPHDSMVVSADRARLIQVFSNLLSNAANYTPAGGVITLEAAIAGHEVSLQIRDNGAGIPPDLMPQIFELFTQGKRASDRREGGLGLGLALVKQLVILHGGVVTAASAGIGRGATFTVRLPCVASVPTDSVAPPSAFTKEADKAAILVVDDNADAANSLAEILSLDGHHVQVAHDGPSALIMAGQSTFGAFILDIGLPGMSGTELARHLRSLPSAKHALLIALTGYGQISDRQKSAEASFDHHLTKPADVDALLELLNDVAGAKKT